MKRLILLAAATYAVTVTAIIGGMVAMAKWFAEATDVDSEEDLW